MCNKEDYIWCDINHNYYKIQDISNKYLLNILNFIANGGGYVDEMSEDKIKTLYKEAKHRNLTLSYTLQELISAYRYKKELDEQYIINKIDYDLFD